MGMDVDRQRALGLRAIPLWPLGLCAQSLGVVSGPAHRSPGLRARGRRLDRNGNGGALGIGVVSARAVGASAALVSRDACASRSRECGRPRSHASARLERAARRMAQLESRPCDAHGGPRNVPATRGDAERAASSATAPATTTAEGAAAEAAGAASKAARAAGAGRREGKGKREVAPRYLRSTI